MCDNNNQVSNSSNNAVTIEDSSVQAYLNALQGIINRLAGNSASCKAWSITIVSAIIVIVADKGKAEYLLVALFPILIFYIIDSYYLELERKMRDISDSFVEKLHNGTATVKDTFRYGSKTEFREGTINQIKAMCSFSTFPFYGIMLVLIFIISCITEKSLG